jgi:hypothetical protein
MTSAPKNPAAPAEYHGIDRPEMTEIDHATLLLCPA